MSTHSGKFGVIDGESTVRNWSINDNQQLQAYVASNTLFGTGRKPGLESWAGSFQFYGYVPLLAFPGALFSFLGYTAPDNDVSGNGMRYSGSAMASQLQVNWNWGAGEIINGQVDFAGHLALTAATGAQVTDPTFPFAPPVTVTKIEYAVGPDYDTWEEFTCTQTAQWTLTAALQAYSNSCTVVDGRLWQGQKAGPIDWTFTLSQQDNVRPVAKGTRVALRLWVDETNYFELFWGRWQDYTGITVDRQTGAIIAQTVNIAMDGFDEVAEEVGRIVFPDGTVWWGQGAPTTTA